MAQDQEQGRGRQLTERELSADEQKLTASGKFRLYENGMAVLIEEKWIWFGQELLRPNQTKPHKTAA